MDAVFNKHDGCYAISAPKSTTINSVPHQRLHKYANKYVIQVDCGSKHPTLKKNPDFNTFAGRTENTSYAQRRSGYWGYCRLIAIE